MKDLFHRRKEIKEMKKTAAFMLIVGVALVATSPAFASEKEHKHTICHWANGHSHAISIDDDALDTHLIWHEESGWNPTPGHEHDVYLHSGKENKPEDDLACEPSTTTTTVPEVTTTTVPEVTTTTVPEVTTTTVPEVTVTEAPHNVCEDGNGFTFKTDQPCPELKKPVSPQHVAELPHTGSWSQALAIIGALVGLAGVGLLLLSAMLKRREA